MIFEIVRNLSQCLQHMRPLKVLNDSKLILNDQEGPSNSFESIYNHSKLSKMRPKITRRYFFWKWYRLPVLVEIIGFFHKLPWQDFHHLPPFINIFYVMNVDKKLDIPTSSCKLSLWMSLFKTYLIKRLMLQKNHIKCVCM